MEDEIGQEKIIWGRWTLTEDGRLQVVVTHQSEDGYAMRELWFDSLDQASRELGDSFREVVSKVTEEGYKSGRWRP